MVLKFILEEVLIVLSLKFLFDVVIFGECLMCVVDVGLLVVFFEVWDGFFLDDVLVLLFDYIGIVWF